MGILPISHTRACYLRRGLLTGGNSELEEEPWSDSSCCWLVEVGMLTRLWWSSLALPNLMLSYSTDRSRITNTERAMPVRGCRVPETWPGPLCPLPAASQGPVWWRKAPPPIPSESIPSPCPAASSPPPSGLRASALSFPFQSFLGGAGPQDCGSEIRKSIGLKKPGQGGKKPYTTAPAAPPAGGTIYRDFSLREEQSSKVLFKCSTQRSREGKMYNKGA